MGKSRFIEYIRYLKAKYTQKYYNIGFAPFVNDIKSFARLDKINWLKNPDQNKWYADPFILEYDETTITVFVEEMDLHVCRGTLTELLVDRRTYCILKSYELLNLTTHLSFPAILRLGKEVFVYPENGKSGGSYIYRYDKDSHKLIEKKLLANYPLADAVFIDESCNYMLATDSSNPNGNIATLYKRENNLFEPLHKYKMNGNIARNAGTPFKVENFWVRPAQDCNGGYGKGVLLQIIEQDPTGKLSFNTIDHLYPFNCEYNKGLHTFNVYKDLVVIDSYKEPNRIMKGLITTTISLLLTIKKILRK